MGSRLREQSRPAHRGGPLADLREDKIRHGEGKSAGCQVHSLEAISGSRRSDKSL